MGNLSQEQIADRNTVESLKSQISGLGYMTMQSLQGIPFKEDAGGIWRVRVETLGLSFQAYCRRICDQMETESEHVDGGLKSVIFQLGAIGNYAVEHLNSIGIMWQRGSDAQRLFVSQVAIAIQDACDLIAAQIGQEGKGDE